MSRRTRDLFETIRTEGGLLPADLLKRVAAGDKDLKGLAPNDYHLVKGERLNEVVTRSWNRLLGAWASFREAAEKVGEGGADAGLTRERWLLILFQEFGYGRLSPAKAHEIDGKSYPVSHFAQASPIHLIGFRTDLDTRTKGVAGAARQSPHSMVQELLNRSEEHLWGFVSNGYRLRVLRDNASLTRQAYVEFDLEAMMEGEAYSDFVLLWLLCHQSRVELRGEPARIENCWLEEWTRAAQDQGARALDTLRAGVERAIESLGQGFLAHPGNGDLRAALRSGAVDKQEYYRQLLRLVYRLIFLFVAEDRQAGGRSLLLDPAADSEAAKRYIDFFSTQRLRRLAEKRRGGPHCDLYRGLRLVMEKLGADTGCPELALPALGSFLWSRDAVSRIVTGDIANRDLLEAVRGLAFTEQDRRLVPVDYRNLGAEELGSIYESLLELHPDVDTDAATFFLRTAAGHERKTTGSYYTPSSLVQCLLDTALDPVLAEAGNKSDSEKAVLDLKVCDPACGSGHFLIAAAHRIARRLAAVRTGEEEPAPEAVRTALRDVIGRCIYGVDVNPMAVELCKVSLWMEALEPGKPLSFLDHRILCGNSLLGTTPALMAHGIPDEAFKPIEGDDKKVVSSLRRQNKEERKGQMKLFQESVADAAANYVKLGGQLRRMDDLDDATIAAIHEKEERYRRLAESREYGNARLVADAWCAAFVWRKTKDAPPAVTHEAFLRLQRDPESVPLEVRKEIVRLADQYGLFHWHLAFPDVFHPNEVSLSSRSSGGDSPPGRATGWIGGFDVIVGNPPWEMPETDDRVFFHFLEPEIAAQSSPKKRAAQIASLENDNPKLFSEWIDHVRTRTAQRTFFSDSNRYPSSGRGRLNLYKLFLECGWTLLAGTSRLGMVIPSGLATNKYERPLWHMLLAGRAVHAVLDFENTLGLFPTVDSRAKFSLVSISTIPAENIRTACWLRDPAELTNPDRTVHITRDDLGEFDPEGMALPQFRNVRDLALLRAVHAQFGRFGQNRDFPHTLRLMFSSSDTRFKPVDLGGTRQDARPTEMNRIVLVDGRCLVPVYEGKMVGQFDHRQADIYINRDNPSRQAQERPIPTNEKIDPLRFAKPQHWLDAEAVRSAREEFPDNDWTLAFCDVTSSTNERTCIAACLPVCGLTRSMPAVYLASGRANDALSLTAMFCSLVFDYFARLKVASNHLTQGILESLPLPGKGDLIRNGIDESFILPRALELSYTAWDLRGLARECNCQGPPFRWDEERRFLLRCELDAAFFHAYLPADPSGGWAIDRDSTECMREKIVVRFSDLKQHFLTPRHALEYIVESFASYDKAGRLIGWSLPTNPGWTQRPLTSARDHGRSW